MQTQHDDTPSDAVLLLRLIAKIREAAGDPTGKLMQPELVAHIQKMREERDRLVDTLTAIGDLKPVEYQTRDALLSALFKVLHDAPPRWRLRAQSTALRNYANTLTIGSDEYFRILREASRLNALANEGEAV